MTPVLRRLEPHQLPVDIVLAAAFFAFAGFIGMNETPWPFLAPVIGAIMSGALAVRRLSPLISLGVAWAGALLQMAAGMPPLPSNIAIFGVLFVTAAYGTRLVMWLGLASVGLGALAIAVYMLLIDSLFGVSDPQGTPFPTLLLLGGLMFATASFGFALAWTAGALVRATRRARANREAQRRAEVEMQAEQERGRIARDMHDVVAHSLAVVIAQADGARYAAKADPEVAADALGTIAQTARSALGDVRMLLAQLRHREADGPQPTVADIDPLFAQVRAAGVDLRVDIDPAPPEDAPAAVQLAVFRILQEALTNALRHGDDGSVDVAMSWQPASVVLSVANGVSPGRVSSDGGGHGIIGMRERAQLAGGRLDIDRADGRFAVRAEIPLRGAS